MTRRGTDDHGRRCASRLAGPVLDRGRGHDGQPPLRGHRRPQPGADLPLRQRARRRDPRSSRRRPDRKARLDGVPGGRGAPRASGVGRGASDRKPVTITEFYEPLDRWYENRIFPLDDGGLQIIFRDITRRQLIAEEMQARADRAADAERLMHFGTWRWEVASGRVSWSDELQRIHGLEVGEFGGTDGRFLRLHPPRRSRASLGGHAHRNRNARAVPAFTSGSSGPTARSERCFPKGIRSSPRTARSRPSWASVTTSPSAPRPSGPSTPASAARARSSTTRPR